MQRYDPTYEATKLHFDDLAQRYGHPIIILNLIKVHTCNLILQSPNIFICLLLILVLILPNDSFKIKLMTLPVWDSGKIIDLFLFQIYFTFVSLGIWGYNPYSTAHKKWLLHIPHWYLSMNTIFFLFACISLILHASPVKNLDQVQSKLIWTMCIFLKFCMDMLVQFVV